MKGFALGQKLLQSQTFKDGVRIPTTYLKTNPCYIVNIKWPEVDGYCSITLGFGLTKKIGKSVKGQLEKAGIKTPLRFLREFRLDCEKDKVSQIEEEGKKGITIDENKLLIGQEIKPSLLFKTGDKISVSGISKGKGFQGVVKRHGFAGGPKTHGQSDRHRAPGSIGQSTTPGRVYRGKRMAGRMGGERTTVRGLEVVEVNDEGMTIKGLVPGGKNGLLEIKTLS